MQYYNNLNIVLLNSSFNCAQSYFKVLQIDATFVFKDAFGN